MKYRRGERGYNRTTTRYLMMLGMSMITRGWDTYHNPSPYPSSLLVERKRVAEGGAEVMNEECMFIHTCLDVYH